MSKRQKFYNRVTLANKLSRLSDKLKDFSIINHRQLMWTLGDIFTGLASLIYLLLVPLLFIILYPISKILKYLNNKILVGIFGKQRESKWNKDMYYRYRNLYLNIERKIKRGQQD